MLPGDHRKSLEAFGSSKLAIPKRTGGTAENSINKKLKIRLPNPTQGQGDDDLLSPNQGMYNHQYNNYVIYNCNITKY